MASGLPALVSDIPSNLEWVDGEASGWTFRDGDARSLADAMIRLGGQRKRLGAMGRAARRVAVSRADWSKNFAHLEKAYRMAREHSGRGTNAS
jgi:glycosyltransferase involved in cell wall biosynthesis